MIIVWIAPTGVQGLTQRSCPVLAMGSGQPKEKFDSVSAQLLSLGCGDVWGVCVITWLVDL